MGLSRFMASLAGRILRVALGLGLIAAGATSFEGVARIALVGVGFVPILAGALNVCLIAPLLGVPFRGRDLPRGA